VFSLQLALQQNPFIRTEDLGVTPSPTFLRSIANSNYTPVNYWEDFDFTQSVDSVRFIAKAGPIAQIQR